MCDAVHMLPVGRRLLWLTFNEEPHMRRLTENLSPADRQYYWKFVGSLYAFYGALMIVTVSVIVGNHLSKNPAPEAAVAETMNGKLPASIEVPAPVQHAAKHD